MKILSSKTYDLALSVSGQARLGSTYLPSNIAKTSSKNDTENQQKQLKNNGYICN